MEWPRPPVLLGLVLGPLAENRLFLSTDNYGLAWTASSGRHRDICVDACSVFFIRSLKAGEKSAESGKPNRRHKAGPCNQSNAHASISAPPPLFTLAVIVVLSRGALAKPQFRLSRRSLSLGHRHSDADSRLCSTGPRPVRQERKRSSRISAETPETHVTLRRRWSERRTISILLWTIGFFVAIWLLGFSYAVPLTIFLYLKLAGHENWPMTDRGDVFLLAVLLGFV